MYMQGEILEVMPDGYSENCLKTKLYCSWFSGFRRDDITTLEGGSDTTAVALAAAKN